jgi:hypothetical protein
MGNAGHCQAREHLVIFIHLKADVERLTVEHLVRECVGRIGADEHLEVAAIDGDIQRLAPQQGAGFSRMGIKRDGQGHRS